MLLLAVALANQQAITLEFAPPVGQTYRYRVVASTASVNPMSLDGKVHKSSVTQTSEIELTILKREGDVTTVGEKGDVPKFSIRHKSPDSHGLELFMQRNSVPVSSVMEVDRRFGPPGRLSLGGDSWETFAGLSIPTHPVHVGESWQFSLDIAKHFGIDENEASFHQGMHKITDTLTKIRQSNGAQTAQIDYSIVTIEKSGIASGDLVSVKGRGSMIIDVSTGLPLSMKIIEDKSTPTAAGAAKDHIVTSLVRE